MDKTTNPKKEALEVAVTTPPEHVIPKLCNLIGVMSSQERGEVILDFLYYDERVKKDGKVVGNQVAKVALTLQTARSLKRLLESFIKDE